MIQPLSSTTDLVTQAAVVPEETIYAIFGDAVQCCSWSEELEYQSCLWLPMYDVSETTIQHA